MENNNPTVKVKSLAEKAILMSISIGIFSNSKKDKKKNKELANREGSDENYSSVTKYLLRNKGVQDANSYSQKARLEFKRITLPWGDEEGWRIAKISEYAKKKLAVEEMRRKFFEYVDIAVAEYKELHDSDFIEQRNKLQGMFNRADYPSVDVFKSCFYFDIKVQPIESSDFRNNSLTDEENAEIQNEIQNRINDALKTAELDILKRVNDKLQHLADKLSDFDSKFHTSNVTNVCDIIKEVRELNINNNQEISNTLDSIENNICGMNAENIRESAAGRADAIIKTKAAIEKISSVMDDFAF